MSDWENKEPGPWGDGLEFTENEERGRTLRAHAKDAPWPGED